jgi:hypothetical protein
MFQERYNLGAAVIGVLLAAAARGLEQLRDALADLTAEQATTGLAMLAKIHATATRGAVRFLPAAGIAAEVLDAADEGGFFGAYRVADAWSDSDVRAALGNLSLAIRAQGAAQLTQPDEED